MNKANTGAFPPPAPDPETVLASLLGGVVVLTQDNLIAYVNPAAEALFSRSGKAMVGQPCEALFEDAEWLAELVGRVKAEPVLSLRDEGGIGAGNGNNVLAVVAVLRDGTGSPSGTVLALNDLGSRGRLLTDELARARMTELDRLVASIGHEINNPLSGIRGAAQLLGKRLADEPELAELTAMIVRQADRMAELVRMLMELEAPVPAMETVNIHRILHEVMLLEQSEANERGVELSTEFDPSLPKVWANSDQLQQLFLNLTKNAVAASPQGSGRVVLATRMENRFYVETDNQRLRYIAVDVTDNGTGLDEETSRMMFTPFFSGRYGGYGMGLTIARNIATAHRGQLSADNVESGGARFRVTLPVAE